MNVDVLFEKLCIPFCVSTIVKESTLVDRVYHRCLFSINHKKTMIELVKLDLVDFVVILGME